jgi:two-component system cell cycle sensor histidine kinase/response regulator CckA
MRRWRSFRSSCRADGGRREIYAVPGLAEPPAASVAARAFEMLPVASLHIGADGQVLASNRQAQTLLGIGPEEAGNLSSLVEGLGRPVRDWVADTVAERIPTRSEVVRAQAPQRRVFPADRAQPDHRCRGPVALAVLHDATELKSLEQQFVQSQKMQAVGELAGGVAHDFNNLLTAITGHCDLLLLRHDQGDPDYGDLVQISQNANRAASLVGQLLAFSRQQN